MWTMNSYGFEISIAVYVEEMVRGASSLSFFYLFLFLFIWRSLFSGTRSFVQC